MTNTNLDRKIGFFFLFWGLISWTAAILRDKPELLVAFCYIGLVLIGIGFIFKIHLLVTSQILILAVPSIIWSFDFIYALLAGESLLGIVDYLFDENLPIVHLLSLQHIFTTPIAVYFLTLKKNVNRKAIFISWFEIIAVYFASRNFTSEYSNINWVYYHPWFDLGRAYPVIWILTSFSSEKK